MPRKKYDEEKRQAAEAVDYFRNLRKSRIDNPMILRAIYKAEEDAKERLYQITVKEMGLEQPAA